MKPRFCSFPLAAAIVLSLSSTPAFAQCGWRLLSASLSPANWYSVSINPANPNTIYAGGSLLAVSYDRGKVWRTLPIPSNVGDVRMIIIPPQDTTQLFIGGFSPGLWKSSDVGLTWRLVLPEVNFDGVSIVIDPLHPDTMHVGSYNKGFYSSHDRGENWFPVNSAIGGFCSLAIRPDSANVLLGGTRSGAVSKSRDYGRTWRLVTTRQANEVPLVTFDPHNPNNAYASVFEIRNDYGVIKSSDGGETWQGAGLLGLNTWALALDPGNTQRVFVGGFGSLNSSGNIYFSEDGGASWRISSNGLPASGNAWMLAVSPTQSDDVFLALTSNAGAGSGIYKRNSETSPPLAPQSLAARETGTGSTARLSWKRALFCAAPIAEYIVRYGTAGGEYSDTSTAHMDTSLTLAHLQEGQRYYATVIAVDTAGRPSEPAQEISFVPKSIPFAPNAPTFLRKLRSVRLAWSPNLELDLAGYHLYRSLSPAHDFQKVNTTLIADTSFNDTNLSFQNYFYRVTAVDHTDLESAPSAVIKLRPITLERGLLLIDETRDGNGSLSAPSDAQVDEFYRRVLADFRFEEYDITRTGVPNDTMGVYKTLIWYADMPNNSSISTLTPFLQDYLDAGGQLLLSGWNVMRNFSRGAVQAFDKQHFVAQYLHIDTSWVANTPQFEAAHDVAASYGWLPLDAAKVPVPAWNGLLRDVNVFAPANEAEIIFRFAATDTTYAFHNRPVGVKHFGSKHHVMTLGFPLYFMQEGPARAALRTILYKDFGYETIAVAENPSEARPQNFELRQNHPNPWVKNTSVRFEVAQASRIIIEVFDVLGKLRATILDSDYDWGVHEVVFESRTLPSGIYFYRLTAQHAGKALYQQTRKMVVVR